MVLGPQRKIFALGMYISCCLCQFHLRWALNANSFFSGIWALCAQFVKGIRTAGWIVRAACSKWNNRLDYTVSDWTNNAHSVFIERSKNVHFVPSM